MIFGLTASCLCCVILYDDNIVTLFKNFFLYKKQVAYLDSCLNDYQYVMYNVHYTVH